MHRDRSPTSGDMGEASSSSRSTSTHVDSDENAEVTTTGITKEELKNQVPQLRRDYDDKDAYEDRGELEIEEEGTKRKVRVVMEQKSGKELITELSGGPYTQPRWRHSLPFIKPKYPPPPAPLSLDDAPVTPEVTASFISFLFFNWISPLMALGSARTLQATDLWKMDEARSAGVLAPRMVGFFVERQKKAAEYNARLADTSIPLPLKKRIQFSLGSDRAKKEHEWRTKTGKQSASLAWSLSDTFGIYFWMGGLLKIAGDTIQACTPLMLRRLIAWTARRNAGGNAGYGEGVGLAIGLLFMLLTSSLLQHHFFLRESHRHHMVFSR